MERKVLGLITERTVFAFHNFELGIMIVQSNVPILMPVVYKVVADLARSSLEICGRIFIAV